MIQWINVKSSAVKNVGYDFDSNRMFIDFEGSNQYTYYRVPHKVFREFVTAGSVGRYYHENIKDRFVSN